jgi:mRNA-degrading endonuclease RelE of RelBE toxin-antitoxin system
MYNVKWENKALKQLAKIGNWETRDVIYDTAGKLSDFPNVTQVKKLTNHKYPYRLRVGNYRLFFSNDDVIRIITIEEVKKRDDRTY